MRAADDADFSTFVAASSRRLLRMAYLLTGEFAEAEDVLQVALERAYVRWPAIRRKDVPEAYVRKMIVTAAIDEGRRRRLRSAPLDETQLPGTPDPAVEGLAGRTALMRCVRELPPRQRAVLVLRYFDDLTEADTAKALGCTVGTVKSQHSRAMARLRALMPDEANGSRT